MHNVVITDNLSNAHLAVYGTVSTLLIMFFCLFNGIGTAMQPLVATAFGGGNNERVKGTLKLAFITAAVMGALFFTLCQAFPGTILKIYMEVNDEVLAVGPRIVRLYSISVLVVGFCFVCNYFFQSTLLRSACVLISLLRGLVFPVTLVLTLPLMFGYDFIWLGAPLGEILTAIVAILIFIPRYNKLRRADAGELVDSLPLANTNLN